MIRHAVYFWLKNAGSREDRDRLAAGLAGLRKIDVVRDLQIGIPADTADRDVVDKSFDVSILALFDNEADEGSYAVHPLHDRFLEECEHLWERVVVYDSKHLG